jgi:hypothetical protein
MKAKHLAFYAFLVPMFFVTIVVETAVWLMTIALACHEVWHCMMFRLELWVFDVEKDYFFNTPYRKTLKKVFWDSYRGVQTGSISS